MSVSMLLLLLLTAVPKVDVVTLTFSTLTTDQLHTVLCVWTVANRHFAPGRPLVVSMPRTTPDLARSALSETMPQRDDLQTVNVLLGKLHEGTSWPIELFGPKGDEDKDVSVLHRSYILFVWNEEAGSLNETLENQVAYLRYSTSWNPRGRFLVVVIDRDNEPAHLLAAHLCSILWQVARIVNVVVLIPNQFPYRPLHTAITTKTTAAGRLKMYTWFPFELGRCGEVQDVILLDEWVIEHNGRFLVNANLYPAKDPKQFMGCPIKVGTVGMDPYVIMTEHYTQNDGSTAYKVTGLSVEILKFVCEKMNLTTVFLAPSLNLDVDSFFEAKVDLEEDKSDVLTGTLPLLPAVVTSYYEATIPFIHENLKMLVPCPKAIPGTQKLMTTFSLSVWLTTCLVLWLTTAVFWCAGNIPYRTHTYQSLSHCFQNVWAVFMGVAVPQQPRTSTLRVFFFLYVCFCFAISTVFQAFFVSYLVEPIYEKKLDNLDDLMESEVIYGSYSSLNFVLYQLSYPDLVKFVEHKSLQEDCSDIRKCVERMITKRDIAIITAPIFATYVATDLGTVDVGKLICPLDETVMPVGLIVLFKKGNPLLVRFNILMRRYLESGFLEILWKELQHRTSLRARGIFGEAVTDMYFAFSLSHLKPAFVALIVGTILSSVVFIVELILSCLCNRRKKKNSHIRRVKRLHYYHRSHYRY